MVKLKVNHKLIKFVVDWQLNHANQELLKQNKETKLKAQQENSSTKRWWWEVRCAKAPLFVGGGVAHGPKGMAYKIKKINKKVRKLALAQTLSKKNLDKNLHILADVKKKLKTKEFNKFLLKQDIKCSIISDTTQ